jgi:hypothetical protein
LTKNHPYLDEKVMTIKIVTEMTGLSERQVVIMKSESLFFQNETLQIPECIPFPTLKG